MRIPAVVACFAGGLCLLLVGCEGGNLAEVKGTITYNGKPVDKGSISFWPVDGNAGGTAGAEIIDGKYHAKKAPVTRMKVTITASKKVGSKKLYDTPDSPEMPIYDQYLPKKFSDRDETTLELDVKPGLNLKDWDLKD